MSTVLSVQARMNSMRLPGKVLLPLGDRRVLGWVIARCQAVETVETIVVTTGDSPENEAISEWCKRTKIQCSNGPEDDLLARHLSVARDTDSDRLVRITGDSPFVPSKEIDRLIQVHNASDAEYTTNSTSFMPGGTIVDVINRPVLHELTKLNDTHPVQRLRENPDQWCVSTSGSDRWARLADVHLAIDTPRDYWTLTDAVEAVGTDPWEVGLWLNEHIIR